MSTFIYFFFTPSLIPLLAGCSTENVMHCVISSNLFKLKTLTLVRAGKQGL